MQAVTDNTLYINNRGAFWAPLLFYRHYVSSLKNGSWIVLLMELPKQ